PASRLGCGDDRERMPREHRDRAERPVPGSVSDEDAHLGGQVSREPRGGAPVMESGKRKGKGIREKRTQPSPFAFFLFLVPFRLSLVPFPLSLVPCPLSLFPCP